MDMTRARRAKLVKFLGRRYQEDSEGVFVVGGDGHKHYRSDADLLDACLARVAELEYCSQLSYSVFDRLWCFGINRSDVSRDLETIGTTPAEAVMHYVVQLKEAL